MCQTGYNLGCCYDDHGQPQCAALQRPQAQGCLRGCGQPRTESPVPLCELVADLQATVGPTHYIRRDIHLRHRVAKAEMAARLVDEAPVEIGSQAVRAMDTRDGVRYRLADESWPLIRPSGTEPVLRVYTEAPTPEQVKALLAFGQQATAT